MTAAVLITVSGGVAEVAATSGDVDVDILDFDNINAGGSAIGLRGEMLRLARTQDDLTEDVDYYDVDNYDGADE